MNFDYLKMYWFLFPFPILILRNTSWHLWIVLKQKQNMMSITTMQYLSLHLTTLPDCMKQCVNFMKLKNYTKTYYESIRIMLTVSNLDVILLNWMIIYMSLVHAILNVQLFWVTYVCTHCLSLYFKITFVKNKKSLIRISFSSIVLHKSYMVISNDLYPPNPE